MGGKAGGVAERGSPWSRIRGRFFAPAGMLTADARGSQLLPSREARHRRRDHAAVHAGSADMSAAEFVARLLREEPPRSRRGS